MKKMIQNWNKNCYVKAKSAVCSHDTFLAACANIKPSLTPKEFIFTDEVAYVAVV
jgi:hypothetical protein